MSEACFETSMDRKEVRALYMKQYELHKEAVDKRIKEGIEQNRKGNCRIQILDEAGNPLVNKKVNIKQTTHDFKYGANLFLLDELETEEKNREYRRFFKENFNLATLPFYWNHLEPEEGKPRFAADSPKIYRRPAPDLCMQYCKENGIMPKLHCLVYEQWTPEWLWSADEETVKEKTEKRIKEIAERYAGQMFEFEVTNEFFWVHNRRTVLGKWGNYIPWSFETARKYLPNDKLTINEAPQCIDIAEMDYYSRYYMLCEKLLLQGVSIDRIGIQNHEFVGTTSKTQEEYDKTLRDKVNYNDPLIYFKALDIMAELGKPIEFTEVTIPMFGDTEEDEELQADMLKLWYSVWFSHPAVDAIIYWNTVDGYTHAVPDWNENNCRGGLWHHDLTPKKSALMLKRLFQEEWHTDLELITDEEGYVEFRGFYGNYVAESESDCMEFGLHKESMK